MPRRDYGHSYIATVAESLARLSMDQLRALVRLLPKARRPSRKAELIAEIERHLAGDLLHALGRGSSQLTVATSVLRGVHGAFHVTHQLCRPW